MSSSEAYDGRSRYVIEVENEGAAKDYSSEQINARARIDDRARWAIRRGSRPAWIAELEYMVIGFTDLVSDGYLDMMFVHPGYQGLGVASLPLDQVEQKARELGLDRIHTEASTARPFFERRGFRVLKSQVIEKRGETLSNFSMEKNLVA